MRHIAIIGSGPAGYYTAEAALKQWGEDVKVDIFDRSPVPFGSIRTGVAPDHQSIKGVSRRSEQTASSDNVRSVANLTIAPDVSIEESGGFYDAVVLATGAPRAAQPPVPISPGAIASAAGLTFWGFSGLESATVPADKVENADRVVPRATSIGVASTGLVYMGISSAFAAYMPAPEAAASPAPVADSSRKAFGGGVAEVVAS
ncbi:hypothetical protein OY671_008392, partial [Metschnikowia pulcherrima]